MQSEMPPGFVSRGHFAFVGVVDKTKKPITIRGLFQKSDMLRNTHKAILEEKFCTLCLVAQKGNNVVPATGRLYETIPEQTSSLLYLCYVNTVNVVSSGLLPWMWRALLISWV